MAAQPALFRITAILYPGAPGSRSSPAFERAKLGPRPAFGPEWQDQLIGSTNPDAIGSNE